MKNPCFPTDRIEANEEGYNACFESKRTDANPHPAGSDLFRSWEAGYLQAQSVRREIFISDQT